MTLKSGPWLFLDSGLGAPDFNMALDEALLESMPRLHCPVLRFYGWTQPAASFGYFQRYTQVETLTKLRPLVRRPTAGGIVPHDADWTYSLAFPIESEWYSFTARESYRRVHVWIQAALARIGTHTQLALESKAGAGQCFVGFEQSDLLFKGTKMAGAAQRRRRDGLLIQGSVQPPPGAPPRSRWHEAMRQVSHEMNSVEWQLFQPAPELLSRAQLLAETKYSQASYNRKRS